MAREKKTNNTYWGSGKLPESVKEAIASMAEDERRTIAEMCAILIEQGLHARQFKLKSRPVSTRTLNESERD